jgi:hypothetical protein
MVYYHMSKTITLQKWLDGKAPKGTIYTGTQTPYLRTAKGARYDVTAELAREIEKRRAAI